MGDPQYDANTTYLIFNDSYVDKNNGLESYETVEDMNNNVYTLDNINFPYSETYPYYTYLNNSKTLNNIDFNWDVRGPTLPTLPGPPFNNYFCKVIIGENVNKIIDYAFYGCTDMTSVTISNTVTSIGELAFYSNIFLTTISVGNSVRSIGSYAFMYIAHYSPNDLTLNWGTNTYVANYFYSNITNNGYNNSSYTVNVTYNPIYQTTVEDGTGLLVGGAAGGITPAEGAAGGTTPPITTTKPQIKATYRIKFYKNNAEVDTSKSATGEATATGDTQLDAFEDVNMTVTSNIQSLILILESATSFDGTAIPTSTQIDIDYTFL